MTDDLLENLQGKLALSSNSAFEIICVFYFFVLKKNLAKCSFISKITRRACKYSLSMSIETLVSLELNDCISQFII